MQDLSKDGRMAEKEERPLLPLGGATPKAAAPPSTSVVRVVRIKVDGMSCSACSAAVEGALSRLPGVTRASVALTLGEAQMLKQVPDADPPPYTTEELESEEELPRNLLAEREDAKYTTMVARAQHFYLATPPPPLGVDSDGSRGSARPIRAALCTVWTPERAHTAVGLDLWRVPGGGGGSGGEEALVLLDGPGIRKVAVLMAPADMSSAKAADLGVDAGELLVAGIHARSQDVRAKFKCYTPVSPTQ
eukprot:jgi/Tetstr1/443280/TSEL_031314.t1